MTGLNPYNRVDLIFIGMLGRMKYQFKKYGVLFGDREITLNPTGRWMIRYEDDIVQFYLQNNLFTEGPRLAKILYIEHKGLFCKSWISEVSLKETIEIKFINRCNTK